MTALLFTAPTFRPLSIAGAILPNAYVQFYVSGSTTPTDVYADAGLGTPLSNPVEANANGEFPPIYLDRSIVYRAQIYDEDDVLLLDVDPLGTSLDVQPGTVFMFFGTDVERDAAYPPALWAVCDGTNGTPDLVDRFPKGVGTGEVAGDTGGISGTAMTSADGGHDHDGDTGATAITEAQLPPHSHGIWTDTNPSPTSAYGIGAADLANTVVGHLPLDGSSAYLDETGGNQIIESIGDGDPHNHTITAAADHAHTVEVVPPFCALWFLMRLPNP